MFFIAEADAAEAYKEAMPAGRAHVVMETSEVRVHSTSNILVVFSGANMRATMKYMTCASH